MKSGWWAMLALLAGCSSLAPPSTPAPPLAQAFISSFEITGRISVRHDNEGFSGNLHWRHVGETDEFVVQTPLGQGVARVTQDAQGASLQTADGQVLQAPDAENLTQQALGFRLPLAGLPRWVQAQAVSDSAPLRYNDDGTPASLNEQGWHIEYLSYDPIELAEGRATLPSKLSMQNANVKLRLIIDDWRVPAP